MLKISSKLLTKSSSDEFPINFFGVLFGYLLNLNYQQRFILGKICIQFFDAISVWLHWNCTFFKKVSFYKVYFSVTWIRSFSTVFHIALFYSMNLEHWLSGCSLSPNITLYMSRYNKKVMYIWGDISNIDVLKSNDSVE